MIPNIVADCDALMESRIKVYPCHANRASSIGDICERRLYLERTAWDKKELPDLGLSYIFEVGNTLETPVVRMIQDAGYEVIRQQESFIYRQGNVTLCTGHIDGVVVSADFKTVLEIKTMSPFVWDRINTIEDFARYEWTIKYPPQLTIYMFGLEIPYGVWILINKSTGRIKQVPYELDYAKAEWVLRRCERLNAAVEKREAPDFLKGRPEVCEKCAHRFTCCPPIEREMQLVVDKGMIADVEEMMAAQESAATYETLKKSLKERLEKTETEHAIIGGYIYNGTKRNWKDRWKKFSGEEEAAA